MSRLIPFLDYFTAIYNRYYFKNSIEIAVDGKVRIIYAKHLPMVLSIQVITSNIFFKRSIDDYFEEFSDCKMTTVFNKIEECLLFYNTTNIKSPPDFFLIDSRDLSVDLVELTILIQQLPYVKIIILAKNLDRSRLKSLILAGVNSILDCTPNLFELHLAIYHVRTYGNYVSPFFLSTIFDMIKPQKSSFSSHDFSKRELEIIPLIIKGLSAKDVATELFISIHAVNFHLRNIYVKLNVNSRAKMILLLVKV